MGRSFCEDVVASIERSGAILGADEMTEDRAAHEAIINITTGSHPAVSVQHRVQLLESVGGALTLLHDILIHFISHLCQVGSRPEVAPAEALVEAAAHERQNGIRARAVHEESLVDCREKASLL